MFFRQLDTSIISTARSTDVNKFAIHPLQSKPLNSNRNHCDSISLCASLALFTSSSSHVHAVMFCGRIGFNQLAVSSLNPKWSNIRNPHIASQQGQVRTRNYARSLWKVESACMHGSNNQQVSREKLWMFNSKSASLWTQLVVNIPSVTNPIVAEIWWCASPHNLLDDSVHKTPASKTGVQKAVHQWFQKKFVWES